MNGINYEYINRNSDITIVFLHGWGLSGNSFNKIINNIENVSILKIDLPGFGMSQKPKDYFDTHEYSYQIFLLLKKLKLNKIILVGHSFGGRLCVMLSSVFDVKIVYCVLTSSAGLNKFSIIKNIKILRYKIIRYLVDKKIIKQKILENFGSKDYKNADPLMRKILTRVVNQDLKSFTPLIDVNVMLVWDKKDPDTKYWICKKLNKQIKHSKVILLKNGGHFVAFYNYYKFSKILNKITSTI